MVLANRYEVIREVGRGGMGVVYLCRDLVSAERVALKRLRTPDEAKGQLRPEETWWFHQEARAVAALDHPALVHARDFGTLADGPSDECVCIHGSVSHFRSLRSLRLDLRVFITFLP